MLNSSVAHLTMEISEDFWLQQKMICWRDALNLYDFPNISLLLMHSDDSYFHLELPAQVIPSLSIKQEITTLNHVEK